jgi:hypothetical protein
MMRARIFAGFTYVLLTGCSSNPHTPIAINPILSSGSAVTTERGMASANLSAAIQRHDYRQAIAIENDWARRFPTDLEFRHLEPALYLLAGDRDGWENARGDLLQSWRRIRGAVPPPANPSFTIDIFKAGQDTIVTDQCYERAGRFGVIYRFTVISADQHVHSFFTVESPENDNQIARELGRPQQVFTLDHFRPGVHETVAMLPGLPPYVDIRQRVLTYIANPQPLSASGNGQGGLSTEGCSINPRESGPAS